MAVADGLGALTPTIEPRLIALTPSQRDVLVELVRDGADNRTIGRRLHIAENTVKSHMKAVLGGFGAANRTEVVVAYLRGHVVVRGARDLDQPAGRVSA